MSPTASTAQQYAEDEIRDYVEMEAEDEQVRSVEEIVSRHLRETKYTIWDVQTDRNRWWVTWQGLPTSRGDARRSV